MFSIIAAIGKNRELGHKGQLVFHIAEDMKFFRNTTTNHKIVMGRKTWESLPGKLPERENIVVSRHKIPDADATISDLPNFITTHKDSPEEIFIIGGGTIYKEFLPYATSLYLTEIDASAANADVFFPDFDKTKYTKTIIKKGKENDLTYAFTKYNLNQK